MGLEVMMWWRRRMQRVRGGLDSTIPKSSVQWHTCPKTADQEKIPPNLPHEKLGGMKSWSWSGWMIVPWMLHERHAYAGLTQETDVNRNVVFITLRII